MNKVRRRAADPSGWVRKADGTQAANYNVGEYLNPWPDKSYALKAIRFERMLELAMEGHRFFDLVRTGRASTVLKPFGFVAGKHEVFPIPQAEADGGLKQNDGY